MMVSFADLAIGLIPAGAGNIIRGAMEGARTGAHPRGCGEHNGLSVGQFMIQGSSPRVRGT